MLSYIRRHECSIVTLAGKNDFKSVMVTSNDSRLRQILEAISGNHFMIYRLPTDVRSIKRYVTIVTYKVSDDDMTKPESKIINEDNDDYLSVINGETGYIAHVQKACMPDKAQCMKYALML